jgi:hypothetical protein
VEEDEEQLFIRQAFWTDRGTGGRNADRIPREQTMQIPCRFVYRRLGIQKATGKTAQKFFLLAAP